MRSNIYALLDLDCPNESNITIYRHPRSRRFRITVRAGGRCLITVPPRASKQAIISFIKEHAEWLRKTLLHMEELSIQQKQTNENYTKYKEEARAFIEKKIIRINRHYRVPVGRITIRNQKTCWGSCSKNGNLNFNYRLLFMPEYVAEYIVVHELCHIKEFNHSPHFWDLVSEMIPHYKHVRRDLMHLGKTMSI